MADLMTPDELALWTQNTTEAITGDPFALEVMSKVSDLIRDVAQQPTWDNLTAPIQVRMIAIWVAKRTYNNPDQETSSSVGPLSSRVLDEAAMAMNLTESERKTLEALRPDGGPEGLWTQSIGGAEALLQPTVYVADSSGSDWMIPFLDINDPGGVDEFGNPL